MIIFQKVLKLKKYYKKNRRDEHTRMVIDNRGLFIHIKLKFNLYIVFYKYISLYIVF